MSNRSNLSENAAEILKIYDSLRNPVLRSPNIHRHCFLILVAQIAESAAVDEGPSILAGAWSRGIRNHRTASAQSPTLCLTLCLLKDILYGLFSCPYANVLRFKTTSFIGRVCSVSNRLSRLPGDIYRAACSVLLP